MNNLLLPTIKHVLKNFDTLDPAQKESLELIMKDCGSTRVPQVLSKSVSISRGSLFGEGGFLKDPSLANGSAKLPETETAQSGTTSQEDSGLIRMMRMSWGR